jgi:hypothetical protein
MSFTKQSAAAMSGAALMAELMLVEPALHRGLAMISPGTAAKPAATRRKGTFRLQCVSCPGRNRVFYGI